MHILIISVRGPSLDVRIWRLRQILTSKDGPRAEGGLNGLNDISYSTVHVYSCTIYSEVVHMCAIHRAYFVNKSLAMKSEKNKKCKKKNRIIILIINSDKILICR